MLRLLAPLFGKRALFLKLGNKFIGITEIAAKAGFNIGGKGGR